MAEMKAPVFVKIEDYKDIVDVVALMREKLQQAKMLMHKINQLKNQEDQQLASWSNELSQVEESVKDIDHSLLRQQ